MAMREMGSAAADGSAGAGGRPDFVSFRDRLTRLVDSLVGHRPVPPGQEDLPSSREKVTVTLESSGVSVTFELAALTWKDAFAVTDAFRRAFGRDHPLLAHDTFRGLSFRPTELQAGAYNRFLARECAALSFSESFLGRYLVTIGTPIQGFDMHFEVFVTEAARLLLPPVDVPRPAPADLEAWHREFARDFEELGCRVFREGELGWKDLVGLEAVRERLERSILLPLTRGGLYARVTRAVADGRLNLLPRGVLLHGPPGTGKTWSMRALAGEAGLPVVVLPVDAVLTKWYGESERRLAAVFRLCRQAGRMILLIDEIDALARHRRDAHEASARLVSILLTEMDGLGGAGDLVLVGAANELGSIDQAVLSRFDVRIEFALPGRAALGSVLSYYARQLAADETAELAARMEGWSFRRVARFAQDVVRSYVAALDLTRLEASSPPLPRMEDYLSALEAVAPRSGNLG
jgi:hypothetical protein